MSVSHTMIKLLKFSDKHILGRTDLEKFLFFCCLWRLNSTESYNLHPNRQQSALIESKESTELVLITLR